MKEPVRHSRITQHAHVAGIRIRKNRLGAKLIGNLLEARADLVQRLVPGDSREVARIAFALSLGRCAAHGMHHSIGRVDAIKIFRHFGAKKAARYRMRRIALDARGPAVFHGNQNSAGVRTIVRANGMNDLLHRDIIRSSIGIRPV